MRAIIQQETQGIAQTGKTGEMQSLAQWLPATWQQRSRKALGYVAPLTKANEEYVLAYTIQDYMNKGVSPYEYALIHNGGEIKEKKGVNKKYNVKYDTKRYALSVMNAYAEE